jgi:hypothetical protein
MNYLDKKVPDRELCRRPDCLAERGVACRYTRKSRRREATLFSRPPGGIDRNHPGFDPSGALASLARPNSIPANLYSALPWASPYGLAFRCAESLVKIRSRRIFRPLSQPSAAKCSHPDRSARYRKARARRAFLSLSTHSLQIIPDTWFTHSQIYELPRSFRCKHSSVNPAP